MNLEKRSLMFLVPMPSVAALRPSSNQSYVQPTFKKHTAHNETVPLLTEGRSQ